MSITVVVHVETDPGQPDSVGFDNTWNFTSSFTENSIFSGGTSHGVVVDDTQFLPIAQGYVTALQEAAVAAGFPNAVATLTSVVSHVATPSDVTLYP